MAAIHSRWPAAHAHLASHDLFRGRSGDIQLWEMGLPSGPALSQLYVWPTAHAGFLRLSGGIVLGERGEEG